MIEDEIVDGVKLRQTLKSGQNYMCGSLKSIHENVVYAPIIYYSNIMFLLLLKSIITVNYVKFSHPHIFQYRLG